jgi:putative transposase
MLSYTLDGISYREAGHEEERVHTGADHHHAKEGRGCLAQGSTAVEVVRKLGITEQTYYRWRREYGGMRIEQTKRLKELEKENVRLKRLVADLSLGNAILKEVSRGDF